MSGKEIANKAISLMNKKITDEIFLIIENDEILKNEYLREVEVNGSDSINTTIGKKVKEAYRLINDDRENNPRSTLIKSYQKFK